ncbi:MULTISPECIES: hypothetical protein [Peptoniphilus]|uniref:hypothetical protein n=1 Tax=Peptoniphilus TaxID=162289 RepID=UPI0001DA9B29|nr:MULTISPECIES: hypothetical protein [Peptoniphilus]EFI42115.1 hypothetical protein HMPREF0629_00755 [Peptoniphilus sp. oral taxon 386 str. F0131]
MKKGCKYVGIILSAILPIVTLMDFNGINVGHLYNWLWCGFYGCIIVCILSKSKIYKAVAIILNLMVISLLTLGALMGGIYGLWIILLHLLIPFYSALI